jgi:hypothetical protein
VARLRASDAPSKTSAPRSSPHNGSPQLVCCVNKTLSPTMLARIAAPTVCVMSHRYVSAVQQPFKARRLGST